jgi:hypothetical protein
MGIRVGEPDPYGNIPIIVGARFVGQVPVGPDFYNFQVPQAPDLLFILFLVFTGGDVKASFSELFQ